MSVTTSRPVRRRVRRNRITERDALIVAGLAVGAGLAACFAGAAPTAWGPGDVVVTWALVAFVTWAAASAPWWVLGVSAAVATIAANDLVWGVLGAVAFVIAAVVGAEALSAPWGRAASAGLTLNVLLRWDQEWFHGWSALVTAAIAVAIVWSGLARRGRLARRTVRRATVALAVFCGLATIGAVVAALLAQGKLREGERELRSAASAIREGDIEAAVERLSASHELLAAARGSLDRVWVSPARVLPFVGPHVDAAVEITASAEELAETAVESVAQINVDSLRMINGVIDINAIEALEVPLRETAAALARADEVMERERSSWLIAPFGDLVDDLHEEVASLVDQTTRAADAVTLGPSMLGADGPRSYFVAFTTPAESRGLGGFMGTFAELRADRGRLTIERTGQTSELNRGLGASRPVLDMPAYYLSRYGRFGAGEDGRPVSVDFWSNLTMPPDLPTVAEVIAQLYPASGGSEVDGFVVLDVETIARFLSLTGPISVDGPAGPIHLDENTATEWLLRTQYSEISEDGLRDAVLEEITTTLLQAVFGGELPAPRAMATTLGPAMAEGRLSMWSLDAHDQTILRELGVSGELPAPTGDGLAVVSNNASANKLDAYLRRSIAYDVEVDEKTGELRSTVTIRLGNDAPADLPADAGGNPFGLPPGTNRTYLSIYSPWEFTSATLNGETTGMEVEQELGWKVYSRFIDIPRGEEVEVRLGFAGRLPAGEAYSMILRSQPLALPDVVRVDVRTTAGESFVSSHGIRHGVETLPTNRDV